MNTASGPGWARGRAASNFLWIVAALGIGSLFWSLCCSVPGLQWNPPRFAPAFALVHGLNPYGAQGAADQLGWQYGPVFIFWSLPATFAPTLTSAFWIWWGLNLAALLVPFWMLLGAVGIARPRRVFGGVLLCLLLLSDRATLEMLQYVHVDFLCIGFMVVALVAAVRASESPSAGWVHLAAVATALAAWTKQTGAFVAPPVVLWLWLQPACRRSAYAFCVWTLVYGIGLGALFCAEFGADRLLFNMWRVRSQLPARDHGWAHAGHALLNALAGAWVWLLAVGCIVIFRRKIDWRPLRSRGCLLGLTIVGLLPIAVYSMTRSGVGTNSLHSLPLFAMGIAALLTLLLTQAPHGGVLLVMTACSLASAWSLREWNQVLWKPYQGADEQLQVAMANQNRAYFPWNPILTILSDHKVYPFDDALYCQWLVHADPTPGEVVSHLPRNPLFFYPEPCQSTFALTYFRKK